MDLKNEFQLGNGCHLERLIQKTLKDEHDLIGGKEKEISILRK